MHLKKLLPALLMALCITIMSPVTAGTAPFKTENPKEVLAKQIESRLLEIRNMDKTNLTQEQRKELRKEVKDMRKQARTQGIYLSVGAIIIIVLLLILLL